MVASSMQPEEREVADSMQSEEWRSPWWPAAVARPRRGQDAAQDAATLAMRRGRLGMEKSVRGRPLTRMRRTYWTPLARSPGSVCRWERRVTTEGGRGRGVEGRRGGAC